jgi:soluble lytic murein transglycosylase-like protein
MSVVRRVVQRAISGASRRVDHFFRSAGALGAGVCASTIGIAALLAFACTGQTPGLACVSADKRAAVIDFLRHEPQRLPNRARGRIAAAMLRAECEFGIDAYLLLAVAERETRFDPEARGKRGSLGLLQIRPATAAEVAASLGLAPEGIDLLDVRTNVRLAAAYLRHLRDRFGSWEATLVAYNAGPTRVRRLQRRGLTPTSSYARSVLTRFEALRELAD